MWKFLTKVLSGPEAKAPLVSDASSSRVSSMLEAIDEGNSQRALPTLVCRKCGLKYSNTGTYLSGSQCPDCAEQIETKGQ